MKLKYFLKGSAINNCMAHQEFELNPEVLVPATEEFVTLCSTGPWQ